MVEPPGRRRAPPTPTTRVSTARAGPICCSRDDPVGRAVESSRTRPSRSSSTSSSSMSAASSSRPRLSRVGVDAVLAIVEHDTVVGRLLGDRSAHERTMDASMAAPDIAATRCRRLAHDDRNMTADGPRAHGDLTGCVTRSHFPRRHRSPSAVSAPTVRGHTTNRGRTTWATQADRYRYRCRYERDDGSNYDASVG